MMDRRGFLGAIAGSAALLIASPAIVRASSLMPVKSWRIKPQFRLEISHDNINWFPVASKDAPMPFDDCLRFSGDVVFHGHEIQGEGQLRLCYVAEELKSIGREKMILTKDQNIGPIGVGDTLTFAFEPGPLFNLD